MYKSLFNFAALILLVLSGTFMVSATERSVHAQENNPARCTISFYGKGGDGDRPCPDPSTIIGAPPGTAFYPNTCWAIVIGSPTTVTEMACDQPPFGGGSTPEGPITSQTAPTNLQKSDVDEVCNNTDEDGSGTVTNDELQDCLRENPITRWLIWGINLLSAGAGVIITLMIVIAGIQYSTAGANPQAVNAAKGRLFNAILALLALFFLYAFLQWLVPGGIF